MCFGGGKKSPAPAPIHNVTTVANPTTSADNSNDAQRQAAIAATTPAPAATFGSELGASTAPKPGV